jgi:hypothetical protein
MSAPLDEPGCARLLASLDNPAVPSWVFRYLGYGRTTQQLPDDDLAQILQRLSIRADGPAVAIDVLAMHIFDNPHPVGPRVRQVARWLLAAVPVNEHNQRLDHEVARLIKFFLRDRDGEAVSRELLLSVRSGFDRYSLSRYNLRETLGALCETQPGTVLDILVGDEPDAGKVRARRRELAGGRGSSALAGIPNDALISWCRSGGPERWAHVAPLVPAFANGENAEGLQWSPQALALLENAPRPIDVAEALAALIEPMSWSGSLSDAIRQRLPLLDQLERELGPEHSERLAELRSDFEKLADREARRELEEHRMRDERFE